MRCRNHGLKMKTVTIKQPYISTKLLISPILLLVSECTFIVLDKETYLQTGSEEGIFYCPMKICSDTSRSSYFTESMVGDVNLFIEAEHEEGKVAEINIMIAESSMRRKQRGKEATVLMLKYGK